MMYIIFFVFLCFCLNSPRFLDSLQEAPFSGKSVNSTISLSHGPEVATQSDGLKLSSIDTPLVNLANVELNRGMILSSDQAVCGGATEDD